MLGEGGRGRQRAWADHRPIPGPVPHPVGWASGLSSPGMRMLQERSRPDACFCGAPGLARAPTSSGNHLNRAELSEVYNPFYMYILEKGCLCTTLGVCKVLSNSERPQGTQKRFRECAPFSKVWRLTLEEGGSRERRERGQRRWKRELTTNQWLEKC